MEYSKNYDRWYLEPFNDNDHMLHLNQALTELYEKNNTVSDQIFKAGDIIQGSSGSIYEVINPTLVEGGYFTRVYQLTGSWTDRYRDGEIRAGRVTKIGPEHLDFPHDHVSRLPSTNNPSPTKPSEEDNTMNNQLVINAISSLKQDEADRAVKPVYKRIAKLVRKTKVGQAIVQYSDKYEAYEFFVRITDKRWVYGNGGDGMNHDQVVEDIVRRLLGDGSEHWSEPVRLVQEEK